MHKVINFFKGAASVRVNVTELEPQGKKKKITNCSLILERLHHT